MPLTPINNEESDSDTEMNSMVEKMVRMHKKMKSGSPKSERKRTPKNEGKDKMHSIVEKMVQMNQRMKSRSGTPKLDDNAAENEDIEIMEVEKENECMLCNLTFSTERIVQMHQKMVHQINI